MTAPAPFCGTHAGGSAAPCGPCATARRLRDEQIARDNYESFLRAHASDAVHVAFHAAGADRGDENEPVAGSVRNVRLAIAIKLNVEPRRGVSDSFFDLRDAFVDVTHPERVRGFRVEVKDRSVVVELHCHADEPTDGAVAS